MYHHVRHASKGAHLSVHLGFVLDVCGWQTADGRKLASWQTTITPPGSHLFHSQTQNNKQGPAIIHLSTAVQFTHTFERARNLVQTHKRVRFDCNSVRRWSCQVAGASPHLFSFKKRGCSFAKIYWNGAPVCWLYNGTALNIHIYIYIILNTFTAREREGDISWILNKFGGFQPNAFLSMCRVSLLNNWSPLNAVSICQNEKRTPLCVSKEKYTFACFFFFSPDAPARLKYWNVAHCSRLSSGCGLQSDLTLNCRFFLSFFFLRPPHPQVRAQVRQGRLRAEIEEGLRQRWGHVHLRGGEPGGEAGGLGNPHRQR